METKTEPPAPRVSSFALTVMLGGLALAPVFRNPIVPLRGLAIDTTRGQALYAVSILVAAAWALWAHGREEKRQNWETKQRERKAEKRHQDDMAATAEARAENLTMDSRMQTEVESLRQDLREILQLMGQGYRADSPQIQELVQSAQVSMATMQGFVKIPEGSPFHYPPGSLRNIHPHLTDEDLGP